MTAEAEELESLSDDDRFCLILVRCCIGTLFTCNVTEFVA